MSALLSTLVHRHFLCARNQQTNLQDIDRVLLWLEELVDIA